MTKCKQTGTTKSGEKVYLNDICKVDGGFEGYVLNANGIAVLIFVPGE